MSVKKERFLTMKCPKCNNEMVISEWDGWRWLCFFCDYEGRVATDTELEEYENSWFFDDK
jgi:ribosomal protein S27AE